MLAGRARAGEGMTEVSTWRRGGAAARRRGHNGGPDSPRRRWQEEQAQNEARQQFFDQLGVFNQQYDVTINRSGPRARAASRADGAADSGTGVPP